MFDREGARKWVDISMNTEITFTIITIIKYV